VNFKKFTAGYEMFGMPQMDIRPEQAARFLADILYKQHSMNQ